MDEEINSIVDEPCECKCEKNIPSSVIEPEFIAPYNVRKEFILSIVTRTENYLRVRRIPELIRFLFTKVIAHSSDKPVAFLEKLLDDCMLFRAGYGLPPVLYEDRHLKAIIKSFDPGERGWLSVGQVRRLYVTLGLNYPEITGERIPCDEMLKGLKRTQESELAHLLAAGTSMDEKSFCMQYEK